MVDRFEIKDGMEVVGSDGAPVGVVRDVETGRILLRDAAGGSNGRTVALSRVDRVADDRVHLVDTAAVALGGFTAAVAEATGEDEAVSPHDPAPPVTNRAVPGAKPRGNFYLPWIAGAVGLLLLFFLFRGCVAQQEEEMLEGPPQVEMGAAAPATTPDRA